jgi:hypothetical protein
MATNISHPYLVLSPKLKLNNREKMFVIEYCSNGFRLASAVKAAGYKEKISGDRDRADIIGARVMRKPAVKKAIADFLANAIEIAKGRLEYQLLRYYHTRAFYNPADIINEHGELIKPLNELGDLAICVEGIQKKYHHLGDDNITTTTITLADREKAMAQLSKYIGMVTDVQYHNHSHLHAKGEIDVNGKTYTSIDAIREEINKIDMQLDG